MEPAQFFDAITGRLQEPQASEVSNLEECTALYTVDNIEILVTAGYKIRRCSHVDSRATEGHFDGQKELFEGELIGCSFRESQRDTLACYADAVSSYLRTPSPARIYSWQDSSF